MRFSICTSMVAFCNCANAPDRLDSMCWIDLDQERDKLQAVLNIIMNIHIPQNAWNFLANWGQLNFSARTLFHGIRCWQDFTKCNPLLTSEPKLVIYWRCSQVYETDHIFKRLITCHVWFCAPFWYQGLNIFLSALTSASFAGLFLGADTKKEY